MTHRKPSLMPSYTDASLSVVSEEGKSLGISYKTIDARTAREDQKLLKLKKNFAMSFLKMAQRYNPESDLPSAAQARNSRRNASYILVDPNNSNAAGMGEY